MTAFLTSVVCDFAVLIEPYIFLISAADNPSGVSVLLRLLGIVPLHRTMSAYHPLRLASN